MTASQKGAQNKSEITRLAIEDAAADLFVEQGYHATSMRQIAQQAGLALGGVYNHFKSKEEIFKGIITDRNPYKKILLPLMVELQSGGSEDLLNNAIRPLLAELSNEPKYLKLMMIELVEFNGAHGVELLEEVIPKLLSVFQKIASSQANLRLTHPVMLMRSLMGMIWSYLITEMIFSNPKVNNIMPEKSIEMYLESYLHGILKETE